MRHFARLTFVIFLLFCASAAEAKVPSYLSPHRRFLLTFEEYRGLRPDQQVEYLHLWAELVQHLENEGVKEVSWWRGFRPENGAGPFWAWLQGSTAWAYAPSDPPLVSAATGSTCPEGYTGDGGFGNCVLVSVASRTGRCPPGQKAHAEKNSAGRVMCYPEAFYNSWNQKRASQESQGVPVPSVADLKKAEPFHPMTAQPMEKVYASKKKDASDTQVITKHPKFICIYAGFPVYDDSSAAKCSPRNYYVNDKGEDGKKTAYSCLSEEEFKKTPAAKDVAQVITPAKADSGHSVLCNPMLFGLDSRQKPPRPFCIPRTAKATEICQKLSHAAEDADTSAYQKSRAQVIVQNPGFFERTRWTVENICNGNYDEDLKKGLQARGRNVEASLADIKSTCGIYQERIADNGWFRGPASRGGARGSR